VLLGHLCLLFLAHVIFRAAASALPLFPVAPIVYSTLTQLTASLPRCQLLCSLARLHTAQAFSEMGADTAPVAPALRKRVLKVLFISLLLDLVRHCPFVSPSMLADQDSRYRSHLSSLSFPSSSSSTATMRPAIRTRSSPRSLRASTRTRIRSRNPSSRATILSCSAELLGHSSRCARLLLHQ
jgi:hypothetical protein